MSWQLYMGDLLPGVRPAVVRSLLCALSDVPRNFAQWVGYRLVGTVPRHDPVRIGAARVSHDDEEHASLDLFPLMEGVVWARALRLRKQENKEHNCACESISG